MEKLYVIITLIYCVLISNFNTASNAMEIILNVEYLITKNIKTKPMKIDINMIESNERISEHIHCNPHLFQQKQL